MAVGSCVVIVSELCMSTMPAMWTIHLVQVVLPAINPCPTMLKQTSARRLCSGLKKGLKDKLGALAFIISLGPFCRDYALLKGTTWEMMSLCVTVI